MKVMDDPKKNLLLSPIPSRENKFKRMSSFLVWEDPKSHNSLELINFLLDVLKHTEGRDKFTKVLQYGSLSIASLLQIAKKSEASLAFHKLFSSLL